MDRRGVRLCHLITTSITTSWILANLIAPVWTESWLIYGYTYEQIPGNSSSRSSEIILRSLTTSTPNYSIPIPTLRAPGSLSHDFEGRRVYWSDPSISMVGFEGQGVEGLDSITVSKIAVDWITKNLYFVGSAFDNIGVFEFVQGEYAILVKNSSYRTHDIALNPEDGVMYWTDWGNAPGIFKSGMDGSGLVKINSQHAPRPRIITVDTKAGRLYWVNDDGIWLSNLEGAGASPLPGTSAITPQTGAVGSEQVFWIDGNQIKFCSINDLCFNRKTFVQPQRDKITWLTSMTVAHPGGQPQSRQNPCRNSSCSRLCVLAGEHKHRCMCPAKLDFFKINSDSQGSDPKLIITSRDGILVYNLVTCETNSFSPTPNSTPAVAVDIEGQKLYWGGSHEGWPAIYASNLDGTNSEMLVKVVRNKTVIGLTYDWIGENLYYADRDQVGLCSLKSKNCRIVFSSKKNAIQKIGTDPNSGFLFVKSAEEIGSATMDGLPVQFLNIHLDPGAAVDARDSRIFLVSDNGRAWSSEYNAAGVIEYHAITDTAQTMTVIESTIYWSEGSRIYMFDKAHPQSNFSTEIIDFRGRGTSVGELWAFHSSVQPRKRINHCEGGLCSEYCVLTANYFKCIGPQRDRVSPKGYSCNNVTSFEDRAHENLKCGSNYTCSDGTCLSDAHVCDGKFDCDDCSDEGPRCETPCSTIKCSDGCHNSPRGPRCLCPTGYKIALDRVTCEDVDECQVEPPVCPNACLNTEGSYKCHDSSDRGKVVVAATVPTVVVVLVVAMAIFVGRKYLQARKVLRNLTPEEIKEFLEGNENVAVELDGGMEQAMLLPFRMILAPDDIIVARDAVLGSGNFGIVYRGFYKSTAVAIKTFKRTVEIEEFKAVLAETKIMAYIGQHDHVVKLIGADVSQISDRKLGLVTELSPHGDLLGYLRNMEPSFRQQGCTPDVVNANMLLSWCSQIAYGMEHLEFKRIVHGDLAARNVLVFNDNVVKITDFGLSKQLYASSEYVIKRPRPLPWRWCALELLSRREFSTDSDIWAFGVTAWEILSLGRIPYEHHRTLSQELIEYLEQGNRLCKPEFANHGIYAILLECWNMDRASRPRFTTLKEFFLADSKSLDVPKGEVSVGPAVDSNYYVCGGKAIGAGNVGMKPASSPVYQNVAYARKSI